MDKALDKKVHDAHGHALRRSIDDTVLVKGMVIVCEGMKNTPEIEGKMGIVHSYDPLASRAGCKIFWEQMASQGPPQ